MDTTILEDLGLTHAEIRTYVALLELGSTTAGPVVERSGLQNSVVHRALHSLIEKGLINYILEGRRRIYQATNPENFYQFIDDKRRRFAQILPELKQKQLLAGAGEVATVYKGIRGIKEVYGIMIGAPGKEYLTFGGGRQCAERMGTSWWVGLHTRRVENRLPSRQVFDETVKALGRDIMNKPMTKVRFLSAEFASFQETVIVGDHVAINVFTENPYSFLIRDRVVAESYRKYFEALWRIARA